MEKVKFYVDMDGTVARFHDEVKYLERMWEKDFFYSLAPFVNVVEGIKLLSECGIDVHILTSMVDSYYCRHEKERWLNKEMPFILPQKRHFVRTGMSKGSCGIMVSANTILLDDYNKNLQEWEAAGGTSVKLINNINNKGLCGPIWQGRSVRYDSSPKEIADALYEIAVSVCS